MKELSRSEYTAEVEAYPLIHHTYVLSREDKYLYYLMQWRIQRVAKGAFAPSWKPKMYMFFNKILYNFKKFNKNSQIFTEFAPP